MTAQKIELVKKIFRGVDIFENFPKSLYQTDMQGWNSEHEYLSETIVHKRPKIIVEIGVWKGRSSIFMAKKLKELGVDAVIVCVDTWLGSSDHWRYDEFWKQLNLVHGYPHLYYTFINNVISEGVQDYIIPLPLDSTNANEILKIFNVVPDMIHIDAGHDFASVSRDISIWWEMLDNGGVLIGDDYFEDIWPGVRQAFDEFARELNGRPVEHQGGKCKFEKVKRNGRNLDRWVTYGTTVEIDQSGL